jgi:hypothetical protein
MKNSLYILLIAFVSSCQTESTDEPDFTNESALSGVQIIYDRGELWTSYVLTEMDDTPAMFLQKLNSQDSSWTVNIQCEDSLVLKQIREELPCRPMKDKGCVPTFDTDVVAILTYMSGSVDTIGLSLDADRPLYIRGSLYRNPMLYQTLFDLLCGQDSAFAMYRSDCAYHGKYNIHSKPEWNLKEERSFYDYGTFANTAVEVLAKGLQQDDSIAVETFLSGHNVSFRDSMKIHQLKASCIFYQQPSMLGLLEKYHPDVSYSDSLSSCFIQWNTPSVLLACESSYYIDCLKQLVRRGAGISFVQPIPVLHQCVLYRNIRACEYLLEEGANIYLADSTGQTAFDLAIQRKYMKMAYLFMIKGYNPQHWTNSKGERIELRNYLKNLELQGTEDKLYRDKMLAMIE